MKQIKDFNKILSSSQSPIPNKEEVDFGNMWIKLHDEFLIRMTKKKIEHNSKWDDFENIKIIGEGGFGKVVLSRLKKVNEYCAIKVMDKAHIIKMKQTHLATNERYILFLCSFKFIMKMYTSFQTNDFVCLCLELAPGGDLFDAMEDKLPFDNKMTRFYSSQVLLGLQYLNTIRIVYRDLKPENILLTANGYIKIADMGLAKLLYKSHRTYTFCGTPEYIAPEIIMNKGYGLAVDWWSFGVMMYEMLVGITPFYDDDQMKSFRHITRGIYQLPKSLDDDAKSIIKNLLQVDVTRRYGNLKNGPLDIRYHPYFESLDWKAIFNQTLPAPIPVKVPDYSKVHKDKVVHKLVDYSSTMQYPNEFQNF